MLPIPVKEQIRWAYEKVRKEVKAPSPGVLSSNHFRESQRNNILVTLEVFLAKFKVLFGIDGFCVL